MKIPSHLTKRQRDVLRYIEDFIGRSGYSPTVAEIAQGIGIASRGVVYGYLKALADHGLITMIANKKRNIVLNSTEEGLSIMGSIAAGLPIEAIEYPEHVDFERFVHEGSFALRVRGDSMEEEGILDGDIIICEKMTTVPTGSIVVALIDDDYVTLKRYELCPQSQEVVLHPANAAYQAQRYHTSRVKIQGIYKGLLRYT